MRELIAGVGGRKFVITIVGLGILAGMIFTKQDMETVKWFGGFIAGLIGVYNVANAVAKKNK